MAGSSWSPAVAAAARTADLPSVSRSLIWRLLLVFLLFLVAWAAYLIVTGLAADRSLHRAQADLTSLRAHLTTSGVGAAQLEQEQAALQHDARQAAGDTDGPLWSTPGHLPWAGRSIRSVRGATGIVSDLATNAVPGVVDLRSALVSGTGHGTTAFPITALRSAAKPLTRSAGVVTAADAQAARLPSDTGIGQVDRAVHTLQRQVSDLSGQLSTAAQVAAIAPGMLGSAGTRSYFVAFENEAETRGVGGLPGAFGILTAADGKVSFSRFESDTDLDGIAATVSLTPEYEAQYGAADAAGAYINSDISPDFPVAARIWIGMWQAKTGQHLDGAIVLDPTALSGLLAVTGAAQLPGGETVDAGNVVSLTEQQAYVRFGADTTARKAFLLAVAQAAADRVQAVGPSHPTALATTLAQLAGQRRLLLYSTRPAEEAVLATEPIAGLLAPVAGADSVAGPYLMVDLVNAAGNKIDAYVQESVTWRAAGCSSRTRSSTVTVTLANNAPAGLPPYAAARLDSEKGDGSPYGTDRLLVSVRPTAGSTFDGLTVDGRAAGIGSYVEQGRPSYVADVEVRPKATRTLSFHLTEPSAAGAATFVPQPLVNPQETEVDVPTCS